MDRAFFLPIFTVAATVRARQSGARKVVGVYCSVILDGDPKIMALV
jgi:hypothetical protein